MDPRLLRYYNQELQYLHEMGAEFAQQFPVIAARLGMEGIEVTDPYVERLLEGVAFLAARVQLKLDAEFPRFTQRLLQMVYPTYLAPTPAMVIAQLKPDLNEPNLALGPAVRRGTAMLSLLGKGDVTACKFLTAHDVVIWPLELTHAEYFSFAPDLPLTSLPTAQRIKGGIRLRLRTSAGLKFNQLSLERLRLFLAGSDEIAYKLQELCLGACVGVLAAPLERPWPWYEFIPGKQVHPVGFGDDEALLPVTLRSFQGYRLLQEYFSFPQRFLFIDIAGLGPAVRRSKGEELEVVMLFERGDAALERMVDASSFGLFCTPAINLFPKSADRIHISNSTFEYHVVADRTRPMDFEIYDVSTVTGYGVGSESEQRFFPFYAAFHEEDASTQAFFTLQREPRLLSDGQRRNGFRSSYVGTEVYLSLVDPQEAPFRSDLRQLAVDVLCTNRDLALQMPLGAGSTDFRLDIAAPVHSIRCIKGPTRPFSPLGEGALAWRFISHLSLNYLSLLDSSEREGAEALRELLALYATSKEPGTKKQIEGLLSVRVAPSVSRLPGRGPLCFGRGLRIELKVDDLAFQGSSAFLFGCVMEQFFARYAGINTFTETILRSEGRGEIKRWAPRCGERPIL